MATAPAPKIKDQFDGTTVMLQEVGMTLLGIAIGMNGLMFMGYTKPEHKKRLFTFSIIFIVVGIIMLAWAANNRKAIRKKEQAALDAMAKK